ncbi:hypothetical protein [Lentibacillus saliphilus]|uniref:hypothetical protein n=1 Tax=Lentibacillus saliphilus TaxID=2737028 RepID=UPI001C2F6C51|nr:hypothetical protein [Lentibacillus saliphilus]
MRYIGIGVLLLAMLVGCANGNSSSGDQDTTRKDSEVQDSGENASDSTAHISIKNIDIKIVDKKNVRINGEAQASGDAVFYRVLHEDDMIVDETKIKLEEDDWNSFHIQITLPQKVIETDQVPVFMIYGKDANGNEINPNYFGIDFIRQSF